MRYILIIFSVTFLFSCGKDECAINLNLPTITNQNVYNEDIISIEQYLTDNSLQADITASGLYYIIEDEGSIAKPELCDEVRVKYVGYLINGDIFDSSQGVNLPLINLIPSWQEGIQLIGKNGKILILTPSYLAYGSQSPAASIPANSELVFEIELLDF